MQDANQTGMIHLHFHPFSKLPEVQLLIFVTFLIMYLVSISGNLSISLILWIDRSLHAPTYFFLAKLGSSGDLLLFHHCPSDSGKHPVHGENPHLPAWLWCPDVLLHIPGQH